MKTFVSAVYIFSSVMNFFLCPPEILDFKPAIQPWPLNLNKHSWWTGSKNLHLWHLSQLHSLDQLNTMFILVDTAKIWWVLCRRRCCCSSQRPHISFSLVMWYSSKYSFLCFSLSAIWGGWFVLALGYNLGLIGNRRFC